jgi:Carboxypeptidase regulatory-like domain
MNRRVILATAIVLFGVAVGFIYFTHHFTSQITKLESSTARAGPKESSSIPESGDEQISLSRFTREQAAAEVRRRERADPKWEWKIPINFYGLAVDENQQPVSGANVHLQWTNLSAHGTGESDTQTDSEGRFSLERVQGKRLLVRLSKPGYDPSDARNKLSFEYAIPVDEMYHEAHADVPVLFYLRKRKPSADVVSKSAKVMLQGDSTALRLNLDTSKPSTTGELLIEASKPWPPRPMSPPYNWHVAFHIENGGFIDAADQFAFNAPEAGYAPDYTIDMPATLGSEWKVHVERTLYFTFGEPKRYGRLNLRTNGNSRYIFLDYVINRAGDRNLEAQPASE